LKLFRSLKSAGIDLRRHLPMLKQFTLRFAIACIH
jgi:hypothetical protein